jgi:hypothetical protein
MTVRAVFATDSRCMSSALAGGAQICSQEYYEAIAKAGLSLDLFAFLPKIDLVDRLAQKVLPNPYYVSIDRAAADDLIRRSADADFVFLNQVNLASFAPLLRAANVTAKIILLSHGCEHTDQVHLLRCRRRGLPLSGRTGLSAAWTLGSTVAEESRLRDHVDGAITLSEFDSQLENWLGTPRSIWIPRTIKRAPIDWRPIAGRFGYVGTLDHAPNLEGLVDVFEAMKAVDDTASQVEIVGGPGQIGAWLAERYVNAEYFGRLSEDALAARAASWSAFLHPIFHIPRGCSTKLAQPIAWEMPILTTPQGKRGYAWSEGALIEHASPSAFAAAIRNLTQAELEAARCEVARIAASTPTVGDVARQISAFLDMRTATEQVVSDEIKQR